MIEGQIETITGDEMIRQPTQSISGYDGRPLTDCGGQCGGCTSHRPDELDADGDPGRCDDCEPGAIPCDECEVVGERDADGDQDDPVLAAIDAAGANIASNTWIEGTGDGGYDEYVGSLCAAESIEAIRTAYLASKQQPTIKDFLTVQPSDGWDFERVIHFYKVSLDMTVGDEARSRIIEAHNADIARKDRIIGELFRQDLKHCEEYARDREEWSDEEQQYKARIAELEAATRGAYKAGFASGQKSKRITELEEQIPKVVKPRPNEDGSYDCACDDEGDGGLYRTDSYCYKCGAKLNWEEA